MKKKIKGRGEKGNNNNKETSGLTSVDPGRVHGKLQEDAIVDVLGTASYTTDVHGSHALLFVG